MLLIWSFFFTFFDLVLFSFLSYSIMQLLFCISVCFIVKCSVLLCGVFCVFTVPGDLRTGDYQGGREHKLSGEPTLHFGWLHLGRLAGLLDKQLQSVF